MIFILWPVGLCPDLVFRYTFGEGQVGLEKAREEWRVPGGWTGPGRVGERQRGLESAREVWTRPERIGEDREGQRGPGNVEEGWGVPARGGEGHG